MTRTIRGLVAAGVLLAGAGCGKKGPPLPPIVRIPAPVTILTAERIGQDVYVTATLPERNVDGSLPVATESVEVWAFTGRNPPPRGGWGEVGELVGRVDLPPPQARDLRPGEAPDVPRQVAVHDHFDALPASAAPQARRFYVAVPIGAKARPGAPGTVTDLDLGPRPAAPVEVAATYDETTLAVTWASPPDQDTFRVPVAGTTVSPVLAWTYNVYAPDAALPGAAPAPAGVLGTPRPRPVNPAPVVAQRFTMPVTFGAEICLVVRAVATGGGLVLEGAANEPLCVTPEDTFPPAPPRQLIALPAPGVIELLWDPNEEADLAGYHVLRAEGPGAPLRPITTAPVTTPRFRDASVKPGVKYSYAVVAIDTHTPTPNASAESNRVDEAAR